jgi:transcriptional regulator GlxA family with amidase domain
MPSKSSARAPQESLPRLRIGFVLTDRFTLTAFAAFVDALRLAADEGDSSRPIDCRWSVLGERPGERVQASCGVTVEAWDSLDEPRRFDYIVVVGGLLQNGQVLVPGTIAFLQAAARLGVPLIGVCTGSFALAEAGLLDGYETCVSIFHRGQFGAKYPDLKFDSNRLFVIDRDRITCIGGASAVHVAAHLIEKHCSRVQALKSVRMLAAQQLLPSNAWQPEAVFTRESKDSLVREAMLLIEQDLADPQPLLPLFERGVGVRQLERRFTADVGISAREYRTRLRMSRARWMVESSDRPMTEIALECGFSDAAYFSRTFRSHFGIQPTNARRQARLES